MLKTFQQHLYDARFPFLNIPKLPYWIEISWLQRPLNYIELIPIFKKAVWDNLNIVIWCIIFIKVAIGGWLDGCHKGMDMVNNITQVGFDIWTMVI